MLRRQGRATAVAAWLPPDNGLAAASSPTIVALTYPQHFQPSMERARRSRCAGHSFRQRAQRIRARWSGAPGATRPGLTRRSGFVYRYGTVPFGQAEPPAACLSRRFMRARRGMMHAYPFAECRVEDLPPAPPSPNTRFPRRCVDPVARPARLAVALLRRALHREHHVVHADAVKCAHPPGPRRK